MGYKSRSTIHDDEWDDETTEIYLAYARKALGEPTDWDEDYWEDSSTRTLDFWENTDIQQKEDSLDEFGKYADEEAEDILLWMTLYY